MSKKRKKNNKQNVNRDQNTGKGKGDNKEEKKESIIKNKRIDEVISYCKENIAIITAIASTFALIVTTLFQMVSYLYMRGQYDSWNIPINYISIDYKNIAYRFFELLATEIVLLGLSALYVYIFCKIKEIKYIIVRILFVVIWILFLCVIFVYFISRIMLPDLSIYDIYLYFKSEPLVYIFSNIILCLFLFTCVFVCGKGVLQLISDITSPEQKDFDDAKQEEQDNVKEKTESKKPIPQNDRVALYVICGMLILACVIYIAGSIYQAGKINTTKRKSIEVVTIEEQSYVIVEQYENNWILKKCKVSDNNILINKDHYVIMDIIGQDVITLKLPNGQKLEDCLVDEKIFSQVIP